MRNRLYDKGVSNQKLHGISHLDNDARRPCTTNLNSKLARRDSSANPTLRNKLQPIISQPTIYNTIEEEPIQKQKKKMKHNKSDVGRTINMRSNKILGNKGSSSVLRSITGITVFTYKP